jgi:hypothetical protein
MRTYLHVCHLHRSSRHLLALINESYPSVLQLGVGLHAGTVLLQSIAEFASAPVSHRIDRLAKIARLRRERLEKTCVDTSGAEALESEILNTQSALELKKVQFFTEYKFAAAGNTFIALILFAGLVWAAISADYDVTPALSVLIVFLSAGPALISLVFLWWRWHSSTSMAAPPFALGLSSPMGRRTTSPSTKR